MEYVLIVSSIDRLQDNPFITSQAVQCSVFTVNIYNLSVVNASPPIIDNHKDLTGSVEDPAVKSLQNPLQLEREESSDADQRQGRNLEAGGSESRPFIKHPPSRWTARSTTEKTILRTGWTPIPNTQHLPKQSVILPFGRKISRESPQYLRKVKRLNI